MKIPQVILTFLIIVFVLSNASCSSGDSGGADPINVNDDGLPLSNTAPIANAGDDRTVDIGEFVLLDGTASSDADDDALSYLWSFISLPTDSKAVLDNPISSTPGFTADVPGIYQLSLVVDDSAASSEMDVITIAVRFWLQSSGPEGGVVDTVAVTPAGQVFAGGDGGLFQASTTDYIWRRSGQDTIQSYPVTALAVNMNGHVFAGTNGRGFFRLIDEGSSWLALDQTLGYQSVTDIYVDANQNIFVGTTNGCYRSRDNGDSWEKVNGGLPLTEMVSTITSNSSGVLFALLSSGIYSSTDNGENWTVIVSPTMPTGIVDIQFNTNGYMFSVTGSNIYRSNDDGITWIQLPYTYHSNSFTVLLSDTNGDIYIGGSSGVFYSDDDGDTWSTRMYRINFPWFSLGVTYTVNRARDMMLLGPGSILVATRNGINVSQDKGISWSTRNSGLINTELRSLSSRNGITVAGGDSAAYLTTNEGVAWSLIWHSQIDGIDIAPNGYIFMSTNAGGVHRSTNNGGDWVSINNGLTGNVSMRKFAFNSPGHIFGVSSSGVYKSIDQGNNWLNVWPNSSTAIAVSNADDIFIGTWDGNGKIYRSSDNGLSWIPTNNGIPDSIGSATDVVIDDSGVVYVAFGSRGVYRSTDNGSSWLEYNNGLSGFVSALSFDLNGNLYAGGFNLVYRLLDGSDTWVYVGTGLDGISVYSLSVGESGHVLAGTSGNGVYRSFE